MSPLIGEIFYWLLNMSILGTLAGVAILLLRRVKRIPRRVFYVLWAVPLIRLWLPVGWGSRYSLLSLFASATRPVTVLERGDLPPLSMINCLMAADGYFPIVYPSWQLKAVFTAAALVWMAVAVGLAAMSAIQYAGTMREAAAAKPLGGGLYQSDEIRSPAVYGVIRPKIVLTANMADADRRYVILHERVHVKRLDNLWRAVALATACLHWFNPLIWIFLKCFLADMELSCDERVLRSMEEGERKSYARALLRAEENRGFLASAFGGAYLRLRIDHILSYQKMTVISAVFVGLLTAAVAFTLLTNSM